MMDGQAAAARRAGEAPAEGQEPRPGLEVIGAGLGARLRQVHAALERQDAFVFTSRFPPPPPAPPAGDEREAARALVLRALRAAADPRGWQVMERLASGDASTGDLAAATRCPRVVAWEQVNDLVQAGLVARAPDRDVVGLTAAGRGLAAMIEALAATAAGEGGPR